MALYHHNWPKFGGRNFTMNFSQIFLKATNFMFFSYCAVVQFMSNNLSKISTITVHKISMDTPMLPRRILDTILVLLEVLLKPVIISILMVNPTVSVTISITAKSCNI